ncbi:hypothetical protein ACFORH_33175 [Amycolatopsis roodepoortensis]|uniref:Uncharacterized protein n=1 Tax=Amycolatopsis roodepoortensis TaxID=700274 RepID=A0ABR9L466_9PSEU|nr:MULTISPECIES: hypothetical protein [Amycolatopsis]MBE1575346.1 hypothetical protein [Amycolatopsis roodepoortensis]SDU11809.1 hypothetical protein SAMN04489733_1283 [Amycolatopsis keratiniphila]
MITLLRRLFTSTPTVEFCDSCVQVCTGQCRADTLLDAARDRALQLPSRF